MADATPRTKNPAKETVKAVEDGKVTVKTAGEFMLIDPHTGIEFTSDDAKTVTKTPFVSERLELGQLVEA